MELKVKCINRGCDYQDNVTNVVNHLDTCDRLRLTCPFEFYGCDYASFKNKEDFIEHLKSKMVEHLCVLVNLINEINYRVNDVFIEGWIAYESQMDMRRNQKEIRDEFKEIKEILKITKIPSNDMRTRDDSDIEEMKRNLEIHKKSVIDNRCEIKNLQENYEMIKKENEEIIQNLKIHKKSVLDNRCEIEKLEIKNNGHLNNIKLLKQTNVEIQKEIVSVKKENELRLKSIDSLNKENKDIINNLESLKKKNCKGRKDLELMKQKIGAVEEIVATLVNENKAIKKDFELFKKQNGASEKEIKTVKKENEDLKDNFEKLKNELDEMNSSSVVIKQSFAELERKYLSLYKDKEDWKVKNDEVLTRLNHLELDKNKDKKENNKILHSVKVDDCWRSSKPVNQQRTKNSSKEIKAPKIKFTWTLEDLVDFESLKGIKWSEPYKTNEGYKVYVGMVFIKGVSFELCGKLSVNENEEVQRDTLYNKEIKIYLINQLTKQICQTYHLKLEKLGRPAFSDKQSISTLTSDRNIFYQNKLIFNVEFLS